MHSITHKQRKLYYAILTDIQESKKDLFISLGGKIFPIPLYAIDQQRAKELLKSLDLDYPTESGKPKSQADGKMTSKEMHDHIRFLEVACHESRIKMVHYEAETARLSKTYD